jgi:hypothetical protein
MLRVKDLLGTDTEHAHQVTLFAYAAVAMNYGWEWADEWAKGGEVDGVVGRGVSELRWLHAIPNGGGRGDNKRSATIRGQQLKAEGVKAGVADIFLPVAKGSWHGLYIEMKRPKLKPVRGGKGGLSNEQIEFRDWVRGQGYGWVVCYGWEEVVRVLRMYLGWEGA